MHGLWLSLFCFGSFKKKYDSAQAFKFGVLHLMSMNTTYTHQQIQSSQLSVTVCSRELQSLSLEGVWHMISEHGNTHLYLNILSNITSAADKPSHSKAKTCCLSFEMRKGTERNRKRGLFNSNLIIYQLAGWFETEVRAVITAEQVVISNFPS